MKIILGGEFDPIARHKVNWIKENFRKDQYRITEEGFLLNDYCVEFTKEKYLTFFLLKIENIK